MASVSAQLPWVSHSANLSQMSIVCFSTTVELLLVLRLGTLLGVGLSLFASTVVVGAMVLDVVLATSSLALSSTLVSDFASLWRPPSETPTHDTLSTKLAMSIDRNPIDAFLKYI